MNENNITLEHIKQAAEWAQSAVGPTPIDGETRIYDQGAWDCGTSCCMWGAACLAAKQGKATEGPSASWANQSLLHKLIAGLLRSGTARPEQVLALLSKPNNFIGADLSGANLSRANLSRADLSGANLSRADLSGAVVQIGNITREIIE